jgi:stalled ribosome rescue protein Dom34
MKRGAGLWIGHRKAVIVIVSDEGEKTKQVESGMEKHVRFSGDSRAERREGRRPARQTIYRLSQQYYDEVTSNLRDAESILIFGPGEAKGELQKRLANKDLGRRIVGIEQLTR